MENKPKVYYAREDAVLDISLIENESTVENRFVRQQDHLAIVAELELELRRERAVSAKLREQRDDIIPERWEYSHNVKKSTIEKLDAEVEAARKAVV